MSGTVKVQSSKTVTPLELHRAHSGPDRYLLDLFLEMSRAALQQPEIQRRGIGTIRIIFEVESNT